MLTVPPWEFQSNYTVIILWCGVQSCPGASLGTSSSLQPKNEKPETREREVEALTTCARSLKALLCYLHGKHTLKTTLKTHSTVELFWSSEQFFDVSKMRALDRENGDFVLPSEPCPCPLCWQTVDMCARELVKV